MKRLLTILLLIISASVMAQQSASNANGSTPVLNEPTAPIKTPQQLNGWAYQYKRVLVDGNLGIPMDTLLPDPELRYRALLALKDSVLYRWSPVNQKYMSLGGATPAVKTLYNSDGEIAGTRKVLLRGEYDTLMFDFDQVSVPWSSQAFKMRFRTPGGSYSQFDADPYAYELVQGYDATGNGQSYQEGKLKLTSDGFHLYADDWLANNDQTYSSLKANRFGGHYSWLKQLSGVSYQIEGKLNFHDIYGTTLSHEIQNITPGVNNRHGIEFNNDRVLIFKDGGQALGSYRNFKPLIFQIRDLYGTGNYLTINEEGYVTRGSLPAQTPITLTTNGSSGPASINAATYELNIPNYDFTGKFIENQYAAKQSAKAWIDTMRATGMIAGTNGQTLIRPNGSVYAAPDYTSLAGLSVSPYNSNTNPAFDAYSYSTGFKEMARVPSIRSERWQDLTGETTFQTVWGTDQAFMNDIQAGRFTSRTYLGKPTNASKRWNFLGRFDFEASTVRAYSQFVYGIGNTTDTMRYRYGYNDAGMIGYMHHYSMDGYTTPNLTMEGDYIGYFSLFAGPKNGTVESMKHYHAGYMKTYTGPTSFDAMYGFFVQSMSTRNAITRPWGFYAEGAGDRNYFAGQTMIGDTTVANASDAKLYVNGKAKITDVLQLSNLAGSGDRLMVADSQGNVKTSAIPAIVQYTPTGSSDATGTVGTIATDDNYIYVKTATGWKRTALSTF